MNLAVLRQEIAAHHVVLSLSPSGKLRYEAPQSLSSELLEGLKAHRDELLAEFHPATGSENYTFLPHAMGKPEPVVPAEVVIRHHESAVPLNVDIVNSRHDLPAVPGLPSSLAHLVAAAASDRIKGGAQLPSGIVMDLGAYVLAWAAAYLVGDQAQALVRLQEAQSVWGQS